MSDRHIENSRTLAALLGVSESEAAAQLDIAIAVTVDVIDGAAVRLADMLVLLLSRTVAHVFRNAGYDTAAAELVIGNAAPATPKAHRIVVTETKTRIGPDEKGVVIEPSVHPLLLLIAACYSSSRAMTVLFGNRLAVTATSADATLVIPHRAFTGGDQGFLANPIHLSETYMAGAGAIGNGIAFALSLLDVRGELIILDPDTVSGGNLNRCLLFADTDIGASKAQRLAEILRNLLPNLGVTGHAETLQEHGKRASRSPWLKRLIVGIDSPRGRRQLQSEIPGEVFDASTTGVVEVVFHHHRQPTETACLACVYHETPNELAHEEHIAEQLGLELSDVQAHFVTPAAAVKIAAKYPHLTTDELSGTAVDSWFKALCSEAKLQVSEGRQVLAPFAFVSVLASAILVIELARRVADIPHGREFNHWRVSPWSPPVPELKRLLPRRADCEFCSVAALVRVAKRQWT
jgi:hypothetical protein